MEMLRRQRRRRRRQGRRRGCPSGAPPQTRLKGPKAAAAVTGTKWVPSGPARVAVGVSGEGWAVVGTLLGDGALAACARRKEGGAGAGEAVIARPAFDRVDGDATSGPPATALAVGIHPQPFFNPRSICMCQLQDDRHLVLLQSFVSWSRHQFETGPPPTLPDSMYTRHERPCQRCTVITKDVLLWAPSE